MPLSAPRPILGLALVLGSAALFAGSPRPAGRAARAAAVLLTSLDDAQYAVATAPIDAPALLDWHFIPRERPGLRLDTLGVRQAAAAEALFDAVLSARGLWRIESVRALEDVLYELESRPERPATWRDPGAYYLTVFGVPSDDERWAFRLEGHHLSLTFGYDGDARTVTPMFFGANPRVVRSGEHEGLELLGDEDRIARELYAALDEPQRAAARLEIGLPGDVVMPPGTNAVPSHKHGLAASAMTPKQRALLHSLVETWVSSLAPAAAHRELARLRENEFPALRFAWAGEVDAERPHGWWVLGQELVLERVNPAGDPGHVHAQWREPSSDLAGALGE